MAWLWKLIFSKIHGADKMTGAALLKWQASMGYTQAQAAVALGVGLRTYARYAANKAPKAVELACKYLVSQKNPGEPGKAVNGWETVNCTINLGKTPI